MKELETARLLPPGDIPAPFGLHLVLSGAAGEEPGPVLLSSDESFARVYLAALRGDEGSVVELAAIKLLAPDLPETLAAAPYCQGNEWLAERWERERKRLRALREASPLFPRLLQPDGEAGRPAAEIPPLLLCRPSRSFFEPPCPNCSGELETCRDEGFLREAGLPSFADSCRRFLWCPRCARSDARLGVWSASPGPEKASISVGTPGDLLEGLARGLLGEWDEAAVGRFPSPSCAAAATGIRRDGGGSVAEFSRRWSVFCLTGSPYILTGLSPVRIDEWTDVLGGRDARDLVPAGAPGSVAVDSARFRLEWLDASLPPSGRLLYGHDGTGLDAVEVFFLKMLTFRQLVAGVLHFYRHAGQPHLDLHPWHVLLDTYGAGEGLPAFWTFEARLHGLASAEKTKLFGIEIVLPPPEPLFPYAAPEILEFRLASPRPAEVSIGDVRAAEEGTYVLEGRLRDSSGLFPRPEGTDSVHVTFPDDTLGIGLTSLVLRPQRGVPATHEELVFLSEPATFDDASLKRLRKSFGVRIPGARYKVFPRFGAPSDLHSLGVLLLRVLAVGEGSELLPVVQAAWRAAGVASAGSEGSPAGRLRKALFSEPAAAGLFDRASVFHRREDRAPGRPNAIPPLLWEKAILLSLRLATRIPGFSICSGPGDFEPDDPAGRIQEALHACEEIVGELRALLFHRQPFHWEVHQILAEMMAEESGGRP